MKHLYMRKLRLLVTAYYLQMSWHDTNLKLTLGVLWYKSILISDFINLIMWLFLKIVFWSVNYTLHFSHFCKKALLYMFDRVLKILWRSPGDCLVDKYLFKFSKKYSRIMSMKIFILSLFLTFNRYLLAE